MIQKIQDKETNRQTTDNNKNNTSGTQTNCCVPTFFNVCIGIYNAFSYPAAEIDKLISFAFILLCVIKNKSQEILSR